MMKRWIAASALAMLLFPVASAYAAQSTDDKPMPRRIEIELELTPNGVTFKFGVTAAKPMATPSLDMVLPAFVEQWLQHMGDAVARPGRAMNWSGLLGPIAPLQRWWTDRLGEASEESETDDPEAIFEEMRSRSILLGLVEVSY